MKGPNPKLRWSSLTEKQQIKVSNGCGPGSGFLEKIVPELLFNASCRQHDFYFRRGGGLLDFFEANVMFYAHMIQSVTSHSKSPWKRFLGFLAASIYVKAVTLFGWILFDFGPYKTWEEIKKEK